MLFYLRDKDPYLYHIWRMEELLRKRALKLGTNIVPDHITLAILNGFERS